VADTSILVVDRDSRDRKALKSLLNGLGYEVTLASDVEEAFDQITRQQFSAVLLEAAKPIEDGPHFLREVERRGRAIPTIIMSDAAEPKDVVETMKQGAMDYLVKPVNPVDLEASLQKATSHVATKPAPGIATPAHQRILKGIDLWVSPKMKRVRVMLDQVARTDITALIRGETGTGKDLVARAIHALSSRNGGPFVKVNCAAMPRELLESELFGHERGAFTGAHQRKPGKFEFANKGTIFLDEIGDLHPSLQAKLLHVLQDGEFSRVGGKADIKVDVRVLAATNHNLESLVAVGRFREDLFYRLNVVTVEVPPLRERREEIGGLVNYFVEEYRKQFKRPEFVVDPTTMSAFLRHTWPGNVRELENTIKRMIVIGDVHGPLSELHQVEITEPAATPRPRLQVPLKEISKQAALQAEREAIRRALEDTRWNRLQAAKLLRISYRALLYKIKAVGLDGGREGRDGAGRASAGFNEDQV
jgi:two-component system response regulator AtoC